MALPDYHDFTDEQNFGDVFQVFEEIRGRCYNGKPSELLYRNIGKQRSDRKLPSNHFDCSHTLSPAVIRWRHSDQRWPLFMAPGVPAP